MQYYGNYNQSCCNSSYGAPGYQTYGASYGAPGCQTSSSAMGYQANDVLPPVYHTPINKVKHNTFTHVVPHIHPIQDVELNTHVYQDQHYYTHQYDQQSNYVVAPPTCCENKCCY